MVKLFCFTPSWITLVALVYFKSTCFWCSLVCFPLKWFVLDVVLGVFPTKELRKESPEFFSAVAETGGVEAFTRSMARGLWRFSGVSFSKRSWRFGEWIVFLHKKYQIN